MNCTVENCNKPERARGLCVGHYTRSKKGNLSPEIPLGLMERIPLTLARLAEQNPEVAKHRMIVAILETELLKAKAGLLVATNSVRGWRGLPKI